MSIRIDLPDLESCRGYSTRLLVEEDDISISKGRYWSRPSGGEGEHLNIVTVTIDIQPGYSISINGGDEFKKWIEGTLEDDEDKINCSSFGLDHSEYTDDDTKWDKIRTLCMREALMQLAFKSDELIRFIGEIYDYRYSDGESKAKQDIRDALGITEPRYVRVPYPVDRSTSYYDDDDDYYEGEM